MAKIILKKGADPKKVQVLLRRCGIMMTRKLKDGSYVCYKRKVRGK